MYNQLLLKSRHAVVCFGIDISFVCSTQEKPCNLLTQNNHGIYKIYTNRKHSNVCIYLKYTPSIHVIYTFPLLRLIKWSICNLQSKLNIDKGFYIQNKNGKTTVKTSLDYKNQKYVPIGKLIVSVRLPYYCLFEDLAAIYTLF